MIVSAENKALVYKLRDPQRVLNVIPRAKPFVAQGQQFVAVRHGLDEVRVLRNLGLQAPSPILYHYDWPGHFTPYQHQRATAEFLTLHDRCFVLNDIGTGKTQAALWAADYLMRIGRVRRVLILSPLSTLERVWGDALFVDFNHRSFAVLHGSADKRRRLLAQSHDFYILNHDGFSVVRNELAERTDIDLVIVDEASVYRNAKSIRYRHLSEFLKGERRLWMLTGTPTPNSPTDAWALAKLVDPRRVPKFFRSFQSQVMHQVGQFRWVPRKEALQIVHNALQPAVRFSRDECLDLPPCVYTEREAPFTPEQTKVFEEIKQSLYTEIQGGTVMAANEGVKLMKLVQVGCGVVYDTEGAHRQIPCAPRLAALRECLDEAPSKAIVFVPLTGALRMVAEHLEKDYDVAVVDGSTSAAARNETFRAFQQDETPRVLLAHPKTMSHGLTLTEAATIVWYGPINDNEVYEQANGRITRPGQTQTATIIHLEGSAVERRMFARLKERQSMQGLLLEMFNTN